MLAIERIQSAATPQSLKRNAFLLLNDPQIVWQVETGTLALFAVSLQDGKPNARRRYLFSIKAGELLFAAPALACLGTPLIHQESYTLLAVALEATTMSCLSADDFKHTLMESPQSTLALMEGWLDHLGTIFAGIAAPRSLTPIAQHGILDVGEVFQPRQGTIAWVQLWQGRANLSGIPGLDLTSAIGRIPLPSYLWLQARNVVEVDCCEPAAINDVRVFWNGLMALQALVLKGVAQLEQQLQQQERGQFHARQQLDRQLLHETHSEFARLFEVPQPQKRDRDEWLATPPLTHDAALLVATGAVGRSLGITICPPLSAEDQRRVKEPLEAIARASRIRLRRVTLRDDWWQQDNGALLAYTLDEQRPVALLPLSDTRYEIVDPLKQTRQPCTPALAETLSPTAYTFYRPLPETLKPIALLQFALRGHFKELWVILLAGIAATLVGMVTPHATAILVDQAIPNADRSLLVQIGLGLFATAIGATLFQLTQGFAIQRLETFADASTQAAVWDRLLNLKVSFFRQYAIGDLSARVSAVSQIRQKLSATLLKSLFTSVFSLLNLGLLFYYSTPLALVATLVALVNVAVTVTSGILTIRQCRPLLDQQGKLFGTMVQLINGVAKFRIAGAEKRAFAHWGRQYRHQLKLMLATQGIEDNLAVINQLLSALTPVVLFAFATLLIQQAQSGNGSQGELSTGTFLAFNTAFGTFISGATSLSTTGVDVLQILPLWERAQPILQAVPEIDAAKADPGRLSGRLAIDHVVFRYRQEGALILDDVSIHAEPGEFIALVGPSGSGKSTLLRLLLGFDVPESGTVSFDGQDLAGLDLNAVRRQFGVVLQHSRLMAGSIFENIAGSALISMDEAWEAAKMAGFAADVEAMPMGLHTMVSEGGSNLSGGQRQRLLIARALALRPRLLLFDEATSALDNRTQAIVSESLDRLRVTRLVVAHRLSTIRHADRIYVLQNGRLMQQGNFDQLAQQPGLFRQLMQRQQF
jgi:NHLM bacteriocin system ABC transporter ATP-binding protein